MAEIAVHTLLDRRRIRRGPAGLRRVRRSALALIIHGCGVRVWSGVGF